MPEFIGSAPPFSRRTFEWQTRFTAGAVAETPSPTEKAPEQDVVANRVYEVVERSCTVRAEPHLNARMKTRKSGGARVVCSEITMNGWLKLASEPGWLLCNMQGIDGVCDVAYPADAPIFLAVPVYQPQGMCCLEVVADAGVQVLESASGRAKALTTLGRGEYILSHAQNFDGWLRMAPGEGGWVCCQGDATLLSLRTDVAEVDLWALADLWASARRAHGRLSPDDVDSLKELERTLASEAKSVLDDLPDAELHGLVEDGFLDPEDVSQPRTWILQRLFAHMLQQTVDGDSRFQDFRLSPRVPPLPVAINDEGPGLEDEGALLSDGTGDALEEPGEAEEEGDSTRARVLAEAGPGGAAGRPPPDAIAAPGPPRPADPGMEPPASEEGCLQPFRHGGSEYLLATNGVLFGEPGGVPVGRWNAASGTIDPVAGLMPGCPYSAICYFGKTFLLMSDDKLLDWDTQEMFVVSSAADIKAIVLQL